MASRFRSGSIASVSTDSNFPFCNLSLSQNLANCFPTDAYGSSSFLSCLANAVGSKSLSTSLAGSLPFANSVSENSRIALVSAF